MWTDILQTVGPALVAVSVSERGSRGTERQPLLPKSHTLPVVTNRLHAVMVVRRYGDVTSNYPLLGDACRYSGPPIFRNNTYRESTGEHGKHGVEYGEGTGGHGEARSGSGERTGSYRP
jgi:hypothetical protein